MSTSAQFPPPPRVNWGQVLQVNDLPPIDNTSPPQQPEATRKLVQRIELWANNALGLTGPALFMVQWRCSFANSAEFGARWRAKVIKSLPALEQNPQFARGMPVYRLWTTGGEDGYQCARLLTPIDGQCFDYPVDLVERDGLLEIIRRPQSI